MRNWKALAMVNIMLLSVFINGFSFQSIGNDNVNSIEDKQNSISLPNISLVNYSWNTVLVEVSNYTINETVYSPQIVIATYVPNMVEIDKWYNISIYTLRVSNVSTENVSITIENETLSPIKIEYNSSQFFHVCLDIGIDFPSFIKVIHFGIGLFGWDNVRMWHIPISEGCNIETEYHFGDNLSYSSPLEVPYQHWGNPQIIEFRLKKENETVKASPTLKLIPESAFIPCGANFSFKIVIDELPNGLAGYNISLEPLLYINASTWWDIVNVTNVTFPDWAELNDWERKDYDWWLKAIDLHDNIQQNATNVTLATITVKLNYLANGSLNISINRLDDDNGYPIDVIIKNASITVFPSLPIHPPPTDPDNDGLYEDINGNGLIDFDDVVEFFQHFDYIEENWPTETVDFNGNGLTDFDDIVELFMQM